MDVTYDARVADAMNRVLEGERAARAAIADCELQMQASLEQARQVRRTILEHAQQRILVLHVRVERALERQAAQILGQQASPEPAAAPAVDGARLQAAIEGMMERITGDVQDEF